MRTFIGFLWRKFLEHRSAAVRYIRNSLPGTATYFFVVTVLITLLGFSYFVAIPLALMAQFFISQFLHSRHTFRVGKLSKQRSFGYLSSFLSVSLGEYLLAIGLVEVFQASELMAAILVVPVAGVASFFLTMLIMTGTRKR